MRGTRQPWDAADVLASKESIQGLPSMQRRFQSGRRGDEGSMHVCLSHDADISC